MNNRKVRFSDRILAIILTVLMVMSVMPVSALAAEVEGSGSQLITDIGDQSFKVGKETVFTFTTQISAEDAGKTVIGTSTFDDPTAKVEYLEVKDNKWYVLDGNFGGANGFTLSEGETTSTFRVTFSEPGIKTFTASIIEVETEDVICETEVSVNVADKEGPVLKTDIGSKKFVVGVPTVFSFETVANDYEGVMVVGTSDFGGDAYVEYCHVTEDGTETWLPLNGDFGPATGFPMTNATSKFRVTFNTAEDCIFNAYMKYAEGELKGENLCFLEDIQVTVLDQFDVTSKKNGEGTITLKSGETEEKDELTAVEGSTVNVTVVPEAGWWIQTVSINGVEQDNVDKNSFTTAIEKISADTEIKVDFVKYYTVEVKVDGKGNVTNDLNGNAGNVEVQSGKNVTVIATPDEYFRVAKVEIDGAIIAETDGNDYTASNPYKMPLTADKDYTVIVTFAPMVYNVTVNAAEKGDAKTNASVVDHGNDAVITITPKDGYTIDTVTVDGQDAYDSVKETEKDTEFTLTVEKITADKNVAVTFKENESISATDAGLSWNDEDALRNEGSLYVFENGTKVTFSTEKSGIRLTDDKGTKVGNKDTSSFEFSADVKIKKIEVWYAFGWHEVLTDEKSADINIVYDQTKPVVSITANKEAVNNYYTDDVPLTVSAKDNGEYSGIDYVEYWVICGEEESEKVKVYTYENKIEAAVEDIAITIDAETYNSADVSVFVQAFDRAGNASVEQELKLNICTTAPTVTVTFNDSQSEFADPEDSWYNKERTATIEIIDRTDVFDETDANNGVVFAEGSETGYELSKWNSDGNKHTATVTFSDEGKYDWSYSYTNKAELDATVTMNGNHAKEFGIDKHKPGGTIHANSESWDGTGIDWAAWLEKLTFGLYANKMVTVSTDASDAPSGAYRTYYYVADTETGLTWDELNALYAKGEFKDEAVTVEADRLFAVYVRIVDKAGNYTYINTDGIIYDASNNSKITFTPVETPNENGFYGVNHVKDYKDGDKEYKGIKINVDVQELSAAISSGIKSIDYTVTMNGNETDFGNLYTFEKPEKPAKTDLKQDWSGFVVINAEKNNGPSVKLTVTVTDNAGNEAKETFSVGEIYLEEMSAVVTATGTAVSKTEDLAWFNADREIVITVTDRASAFDPAVATEAIKVSVADKDGEPISVTAGTDYIVSAWNSVDNTHTATITFIRDGNYSWYIDYTNKAENKLIEEKITYTGDHIKAFVIDKTKPHGKLTVSNYAWTDKILSVLTFGIYAKDNFSVNMQAWDNENISPVTVEYCVSRADALPVQDETVLQAYLDSMYTGGQFTETIDKTFTGNQQFTVFARVTDKAGNYIYVSSDGHIIDGNPTQLTVAIAGAVKPENNDAPYAFGLKDIDGAIGTYYDDGGNTYNGIQIAVEATEQKTEGDSSFAGIQSITYTVESRNKGENAYSNLKQGTLYEFAYTREAGDPETGYNTNGGTLEIFDINTTPQTKRYEQQAVPTKDMLCSSWKGSFVVNADVHNKSDVRVTVNVTDNAGNRSVQVINMDIDLTAPEIEVSYDNNSAVNSKYFEALRTATVTYTERTDHFDQNAAESAIKDSLVATDVNGKAIEDSYYSITWEEGNNNNNSDADTHIATIAFLKEANYTYSVSCTDKAGNANTAVSVDDGVVAPFDFVADTTDPTGSVAVNNNRWTKWLDTLTFGLFSNSGATVTVEAEDEVSPVMIEYYKYNGDTGLTEIDESDLELFTTVDYKNGKNSARVEISSDEQFSIYVKITDKAGRSILMNSDGYIVDTNESAVSVTAVTTANENGIYGIAETEKEEEHKQGKGVLLYIEANDVQEGIDAYSGIAKVEYAIEAQNGNEKIEETGTLYEFAYTREAGDPETGYNTNGGKLTVDGVENPNSKVPAKGDLRTDWSGYITVDADKFNCSDVEVTVTVTDNAGNVNTDSIKLDIDITQPSIDIVFDNNTVFGEGENAIYFDAPRTVTVTVTERKGHFNSEIATKGIAITAKNGEDTVENAYTVNGWTPKASNNNTDTDTFETTVTFTGDAYYTFAMSYIDNAGNGNTAIKTAENTKAPYYFCVDTVDPEGTVKVNDRIWTKILKVLTFGLYSNVKADVLIESTDNISPTRIEYYKTNDPIVKTPEVLDKLYADDEFSVFAPFPVGSDEHFVVYARITDSAENSIYVSSDGYIVDSNAPKIAPLEHVAYTEDGRVPEETPENGIYNTDVKITVNVSDIVALDEETDTFAGIQKVEYWVVSAEKETQRGDLFTFDYTREEAENTNSGKLVISEWDWKNNKQKVVLNETGNVPTFEQLYETWTGSFIVNAAINDSSDTVVYVQVTDNAGNTSKQQVALDIDVTDPVIKVEYDSTANEGAKDGYYTARTATVSVTERTNHFNAQAATAGIAITAKDAKGNAVENAYTISNWTTTKGAVADDDVHTATIRYLADANYTFAMSYTDEARNTVVNTVVDEKENPYQFTVDTTVPTGTVTAKSAEGREETWSSIVDELAFGFWSNTKISVSGTSDDVTSPIQSVEYYMPVSEVASDNTKVLSKAELDAVTAWKAFTTLDVTENKQFTVYLKITDNAGNYDYIATNGLIVDEEHAVLESVAPEITVSPAKPINGIYSDDVKVAIEVVDPMVGGTYSGLKEVRYAVFDRDSATPNTPTQEGTLFTFNKPYPKQSELQQKWTDEITVSAAKNNSNNIQIVVYAMDNSLNTVDNSQKEAKSYTVIKIDTTAPVIYVSYDNNSADSNTYFNANRTATVTVTERNFKAEDVKLTLTNTDGSVPALVGWSHTNGTYNKDDATHTATITYSADGDYTFAMEYTDLAGNKASGVNYANGTVAPTAFTVDKTNPVVSVSYDNNSAQNVNYYKDQRMATVSINEHNFSTDRITVTMTATDDGVSVSLPTVNGWTTVGDMHTATIVYASDALYTFDIAYLDLAGNVAEDYAQDVFYVDNTDPVLEITPETLNGSANNGEVKPVVTVSDTNFDANLVRLTLVGAKNGEIKPLNGSYSSIHNGQMFSFADFAEKKDVDDIYTLSATITDKSGRTVSKSIVFSVNRFGSTYAIGEDIANLNNSYVKQASDVTITEINANELTGIKITLFKNNETIVLNEGSDYTIARSGGNGQWYRYEYTVFAENFADDGVYRLSLHSEDAAGNIAENTLDTKNMEINFGVDATQPTININNLESGKTYALDNMTVTATVGDNLSLAKVTVLLDGQEYQNYVDEALESIIAQGGIISFDISGDSTDAHTLKLIAIDAAGNEYVEVIDDFYVTTNLWVRFYNNRIAFYGSIAGVLILTAVIVLLVVRKRRKEEENT